MNYTECCSKYIKNLIPQIKKCSNDSSIIVILGRSLKNTFSNVITIQIGSGEKVIRNNLNISEELISSLPNTKFILLNMFDYKNIYEAILSGFDYLVDLANQNLNLNFIGCVAWTTEWNNNLAEYCKKKLFELKKDNLGIICASGNDGIEFKENLELNYKFPACLNSPQIMTIGSLGKYDLNKTTNFGYNVFLYNHAFSTSFAVCNQIIFILILWELFPLESFSKIKERINEYCKEKKFNTKMFLNNYK
jgi:hypothetical protein